MCWINLVVFGCLNVSMKYSSLWHEKPQGSSQLSEKLLPASGLPCCLFTFGNAVSSGGLLNWNYQWSALMGFHIFFLEDSSDEALCYKQWIKALLNVHPSAEISPWASLKRYCLANKASIVVSFSDCFRISSECWWSWGWFCFVAIMGPWVVAVCGLYFFPLNIPLALYSCFGCIIWENLMWGARSQPLSFNQGTWLPNVWDWWLILFLREVLPFYLKKNISTLIWLKQKYQNISSF